MANPEHKLVYRAGLIPYYIGEDGTIRMLFMKPSDPEYGGECFQIAKGKVEDDDANHKAAALREAKEEIGLFVGNVIFTEEVGVFMGRTTVFISKIKDPIMFGEPSFETGDVAWMTIDEFVNEGRDLHRPVVQAAYRMIERMENIN